MRWCIGVPRATSGSQNRIAFPCALKTLPVLPFASILNLEFYWERNCIYSLNQSYAFHSFLIFIETKKQILWLNCLSIAVCNTVWFYPCAICENEPNVTTFVFISRIWTSLFSCTCYLFHILIIKMTLLDLFLGKLHFKLTQYSVFLLKPWILQLTASVMVSKPKMPWDHSSMSVISAPLSTGAWDIHCQAKPNLLTH